VSDYLGNLRNVFYYDYYNTLQLGEAIWYNPFGKQDSVIVAGTNPHRFSYNGKELDEHLDLDRYYYGARYYDPELGRFMTPDPITDDWTPYSYVRNNPIMNNDPTGMTSDNGGNNRIDYWAGEPDAGYNDADDPFRWNWTGEVFATSEDQARFDRLNGNGGGPTGGNKSLTPEQKLSATIAVLDAYDNKSINAYEGVAMLDAIDMGAVSVGGDHPGEFNPDLGNISINSSFFDKQGNIRDPGNFVFTLVKETVHWMAYNQDDRLTHFSSIPGRSLPAAPSSFGKGEAGRAAAFWAWGPYAWACAFHAGHGTSSPGLRQRYGSVGNNPIYHPLVNNADIWNAADWQWRIVDRYGVR
jgi:RHS repeat-associated protein